MRRTRNRWMARVLLGSIPVLVLLTGILGCGEGEDCGPSNCAGCCASGVCLGGTEPGECGRGGQECQVCIAGLDCSEGSCVPSATSCGPGNCPDGCCEGNLCRSGLDSYACGRGGESCVPCTTSQACLEGTCEEVGALCASSCSGCCVGNRCMLGTTPDACGRGGGACKTCRTEEFCDGTGRCQCTPSCAGKRCGDENGCGGLCLDAPCPDPGFRCQQGHCEVDPSGIWTVVVNRAEISATGPDGSTWDIGGGAPDVFVCLTIGGIRKCTSTKNDTPMPIWNESLHQVPASSLMGDFRYEIVDEDFSSNDWICASSSARFISEDFRQGSVQILCEYAMLQLDLVPSSSDQ